MSLFKSIWDDFQYSLRAGNMVTKLVVVNFAVFVIMKLIYLGLSIFTMGSADEMYLSTLKFLCLQGELGTLAWQPWGIVTHMFLHDDFLHLLNNLVAFYIFGRIVSDLIGDRRILPIYLLGGLVGGVIFVVTAQFFLEVGSYALGASGAVMALGGAALILAPDYRVNLLFLGSIKVKYIVLILFLLDLVAIAGKSNTGGHAAHIGGFATGCFFVYQLRDGRDWAVPIDNFFAWVRRLFSSKPGPKFNRPKNAPTMRATFGGAKGSSKSDSHDGSFQEKLDAILDKIKAQGYESLSQEEKDFLYEASQK
ncbi:MAG: rhomboid family intramembrane serine protease [Saprospiraceae bacterium]|nr:rhomboid family intramembrane serine protease [Lewinellaceae bacterium]MBP6809887.1 rhomboid family intramembrane serine protease [Saprospiraceae bacterium]